MNDARVVDEHIDRAEAIVDGGDHRVHVLLVSDVTGNSHHFTAKLFEVESGLIEFLFVACGEHENNRRNFLAADFR